MQLIYILGLLSAPLKHQGGLAEPWSGPWQTMCDCLEASIGKNPALL